MPHDTAHDLITALQLELAILMEELETVVVGPLPSGARRRDAARRLAVNGQDIATLSGTCEFLTRRRDDSSKTTGLGAATKR